VLGEMATLARQIAQLGARFALSPGSYGTPEARRELKGVPPALGLIYAGRSALPGTNCT
jgi:hypothetical protein